ncbi:NUDIX domain-containing protein [Rhodovulum kholense]|uniref:ADP-ribose pyrophosphatase n=1 Tax=Rhodovulum kholense TaxID=453584 RepID=A0A8E2VNM0_9RHOB|nr:NUDIX domain-containing protein [Rhodovulum kholense]PTW51096.1 nudix-type nucleoside diphosphatase (YffH/AdpP family) [Rhodovulum kholense]
MERMFFYGTLCHLPLLARVLDRPADRLTTHPARLADYAVRLAEGESFPLILPEPGRQAEGLLVDGLTAEDRARLDYYEGGYGFDCEEVTVETADGPIKAGVYAHDRAGLVPGAAWDIEAWRARWGDLVTEAAREVMLGYPDRPPEVNARRYRMILARAASTLRARQPGPATLRKPTGPGDIVETARVQPYANFFAVEEYTFRHTRFDGRMSDEMVRAAFLTGDAATVLPYDPARDAVLLIEQVRAGPYARGDSQVWSVEAIAGLMDPGETPEETVRREALEEAGLTIGALHRCFGYYTSPGAKAEYIYSFVGEADLGAEAGGLGGVPAEGEDIRAHVVPFARAMDLVDTGEIGNAPLILSLLWLARHREAFRPPA